MAAAPRALVQRTPLAATPGGPQVVRSIVAPAKRALGRTELQATGTQHPGSDPIPPRPIAELPATGGIPPGSFTSHQATGTLYSQSVLFRAFPKLFGAEPELFPSSSTECSLVILGWRFLLGVIPFIRRRQGSAMTGS